MPQDPFNGTWKLSVAASTLPFAPPRSVVARIEADETSLTIVEDSVSADGAAETVTIRARFDDQVHAVRGSSLADGFAVRRVDGRTWKTRGLKAGRVAFTATLRLAPDGRSFREEANTALSDGTRADATLVYERVAPAPGVAAT